MENRIIYTTDCRDRNKIAKTLWVTAEMPNKESDTWKVEKGTVTLRSLSKAGVVLTSSQFGEFVEAMVRARTEMADVEFELHRKTYAKVGLKAIKELE